MQVDVRGRRCEGSVHTTVVARRPTQTVVFNACDFLEVPQWLLPRLTDAHTVR